MNAGNTLADMGRHPESLPVYHSALRLKPSGKIFHNLGLALHALKRDNEAIDAFAHELAHGPDQPAAHALHGIGA